MYKPRHAMSTPRSHRDDDPPAVPRRALLDEDGHQVLAPGKGGRDQGAADPDDELRRTYDEIFSDDPSSRA